MQRLLIFSIFVALYLWSSAFTVNAPQSPAQSVPNEYSVDPDNSIKTVGIIRNLSDEELLEIVQRQTFRYFWHYAHPGAAWREKGAIPLRRTSIWITSMRQMMNQTSAKEHLARRHARLEGPDLG